MWKPFFPLLQKSRIQIVIINIFPRLKIPAKYCFIFKNMSWKYILTVKSGLAIQLSLSSPSGWLGMAKILNFQDFSVLIFVLLIKNYLVHMLDFNH
jgi:hypothetical protein